MAFWSLFRPLNLLMMVVTLLLSTRLLYEYGAICELPQFLWMLLSVVLVAGFGNLINDIADIDTDKISNPDRWLVQNPSALRTIKWVAAGLLICGLGSGLLLSRSEAKVVPFLAAGLLWFYTARGQYLPVLGNLIVSALLGIVMVFPVLVVRWESELNPMLSKGSRLIIVFGLLAFFASFIREIVKDVEDREADQLKATKSIGGSWSMGAVKATIALLIAMQIVCIGLLVYYASTLALSAYVSVWAVVLIISWILFSVKLYRSTSLSDFTTLSRWAKVVMAAGLFWIVFFIL